MPRALLVLPLALLLIARAPEATAGDPLPAAQPIAAANNAFAGDLFRQLRGDPGSLFAEERGESGNLFFSPYSVSVALAMVREGAKGETADEIDRALHLPVGGPGDGYRALAESLRPGKVRLGRDSSEDAYRLAVANALWGQEGYAFVPEYPVRLAEAYGALFRPLDFRDPAAARAAINGWVEEATQRKIKDLIPEGQPPTDTRLVLTNAVYFKASWMEPFSEPATEEGPFTKQDGTEVKVKFMRQVDTFRHGETERAQVLEMAYAGGESSMVVVLPKARDGLPALEEAEGIDLWVGSLSGATRVAVQYPRFKFTSSYELTPVLKRLGIARAFDFERSDFTGIATKEPLFVGFVLHKAFVAVDERGTEAAAATAIGLRAGSARPPAEPIPFVADHPFLFLIRHRATGAVLFMGRVSDPTAS